MRSIQRLMCTTKLSNSRFGQSNFFRPFDRAWQTSEVKFIAVCTDDSNSRKELFDRKTSPLQNALYSHNPRVPDPFLFPC